MIALPGLDGLENCLQPYRNSSAYIIEIQDALGRRLGNNGDELMYKVFRKILNHLRINVIDDKRMADVLIVPPNGALLQAYSYPRILEASLQGFETIPLVIFPSSAFFPTVNPAGMFRNRTAATTWILREESSYRHLNDLWAESLAAIGVRLELDHDVVISGHRFTKDLLKSAALTGGRPLICGRLDMEASSESLNMQRQSEGTGSKNIDFVALLKKFRLIVPYGRIATFAARVIRKKQLRSAAESLATRSAISSTVFQKARYVDASSPLYATFDQYLLWVATAPIVVTDRLHVGLPAAITGAQVVLVEAGYHKLSGVYDRSLSHLPNVRLIRAKPGTGSEPA